MKISKKKYQPSLRERMAMAMCACDTVHMAPMMRDANDILQLPEDDTPVYREHACVCARDGRQPVSTIITCAEMLIKADAALEALNAFIKEQ